MTPVLPWIDDLWHDLHYALRLLRKSPGFTIVAVAALAIGIGVNLTIFGFASALFFKPLNVADPARVVPVDWSTSVELYAKLRDGNSSFDSLALYGITVASLRVGAEAEVGMVAVVTGNYFSTIGIPAAIGRAIAASDDEPGATPVAVISDRYWRRRFAADSSIVGRSIYIRDTRYTVIGVAPAGFDGMNLFQPADIWTPLHAPGVTIGSGDLIGRLRNGFSKARAQADLRVILDREMAPFRGQNFVTEPSLSQDLMIARDVLPFAGFVFALTGLILLIVCLNLSSLLMARTAARHQEMGVRMAVGASRLRLARQMSVENLVLGLLGSVAAIPLASITAHTIDAVIAARVPDLLTIHSVFNWHSTLFTVGIAFLAPLLFGMAPLVMSLRTSAGASLKSVGLTAAPDISRLRQWFIVAEIGMSTVLLLTAFMWIRELTSVERIDPGFTSEGILVADLPFFLVDPPPAPNPHGSLRWAAPGPERAGFYENVLRNLEMHAGVKAAALARRVQLGLHTPVMGQNEVSPGYFRALNIPMVEGRDFQASDRGGAPEVAIVNETYARRTWPGENPVGKSAKLTQGYQEISVEIVGLVADSKYKTLNEAASPMVYRPLAQDTFFNNAEPVTLLVKAAGTPMSVLPAVRNTVRALRPDLPLTNVMTLDHATETSRLPLLVTGSLAGVLGAIALALAAMEIYGVMSYLARQRTREIGIRIALGAKPSSVVVLMTRQAMVWTGAGLTLGLLVTFAVGRLGVSLIYSLRHGADPLICIAVALLLGLIGYSAAYIPARRASRIDPLHSLREE